MNLRGAKVVVTGADGFIGSHLAELLVSQGSEVTAFCYYNSFNSRGWLDTSDPDVVGQMRIVMGDVRDTGGVRDALKGADAVYHLAALIGIPFSYAAPESYVDTNIKGTLNVLQAARDHEMARVVVTSTSETYGTALHVPIGEGHPLQAQSPYSATKIAADKLAESFHLAFGLPVTTVRPFNTYGPRQSARAIIPTIISQLMAGVPALKLGSLHPTRDLTFVADTVAGFAALGACDAAVGRAVNLGSGREVSIGALAELLIERIAPGTPVETEPARLRPDASEVERLLADTSLVRELTGWEPQYSLEEGLARTVEWFGDPSNRASYKLGYTT